MIKMQVWIPNELLARARRVAAQKGWSFAEIVRRGLEQMVLDEPEGRPAPSDGWKLPGPVDLGLKTDPFADLNWREETNLGSGATGLATKQSRARTSRIRA